MVSLICRVINGGENVFTFQKCVISKNFLKGRPGSEQFKNMRHTNAMTANAGTTSTLAFFHRNSAKTLKIHWTNSKIRICCFSHERNGLRNIGRR